MTRQALQRRRPSKSGTDATAGFGIQLRGEGNAAFRLEAQHYQVDTLEIDMVTINLIYYF